MLASRMVVEVTDAKGLERADVLRSIRKAAIIRLEDGGFRAPEKGRVFVRVPGDDTPSVDFVDPELAAIAGVREALQNLGIVVMDRSGELRRLLAEETSAPGLRDPGNVWPAIWAVMRDLRGETALNILGEDLGRPLEEKVRIRTAAGAWVPIGHAYLAGRLIPGDGRRDRDQLIDPHFHAPDEDLLHKLGAVDAPVWRSGAPDEAWLAAYREEMKDAFIAEQPGGRRPDRAKMEVTRGERGTPPPWPMSPLINMSAEGRAAATEHLMTRPVPNPWSVRRVSGAYRHVTVIAPEVWFLRKNGRLNTSFGALPVGALLRASDLITTDALPAVELSDAWSKALCLHTDPDELSADDWLALKRIADTWTGPNDDARRSAFYAWLPGRVDVDSLVIRVGRQLQRVEVKNVGVTADSSIYDSMLEAQVPALLVADEDVQIFIEWGMPEGKDLLQEEIVVETAGEASYLTDLFPPLKMRLDPTDQELLLQAASRIVKMIATPRGQIARPIPYRRDGELLLVTATSSEKQLAQVSDLLGLGFTGKQIAEILNQMEQTAANKLRTQIRKAPNDDMRLVVAAGEDALRRCVPAQALQVLDDERGGASPIDVAALARAVHGVAVLKQLRPAFDERGLEPPKEWSTRARRTSKSMRRR